MIEKQDLRSIDVLSMNINKLKELFPEIFTEGDKIDFNKFKLNFSDFIDDSKERYGLNWNGKSECFKTVQAQSLGTLLPLPKKSLKFETSSNVFIEGDNLEVLKLLQKRAIWERLN